MELTRTHGIDRDSWYRHGLMVLTWTLGMDMDLWFNTWAHGIDKDAKTFQQANNVGVKKSYLV